MAEHVTCCPHCNTSFKINDEHLEIAKGAVRCGSCLKVFNAKAHIEKDSTLAETESENEVIEDLDDDMLISDDMDDEGLSLGELSSELKSELDSTNSGDSLFERRTKPKSKETDEDIDESWAQQLLEDDPAHIVDDDNDLLQPTDDTNETPRNSHSELAAEDDSTSGGFEEYKVEEDDEFYIDENDRVFDDEQSSGREIGNETDKLALLSQIAASPVEMISREERRSKIASTLWTLGVVISFIVFTAQIAWHQRDNLSRQPQLRPIYELSCNMIGCTIPPLYQPEKIKISSVVVRPHSAYQDVLVVDFVVLNTAANKQPFREIQVLFSDIENKVLASRNFLPLEYLAGELAGATNIAPNQPVHISLEFLDPGPAAVNYKLSIVL